LNEKIFYLANPVVSCRDEGDDGALLYNPDTDEAILINTTGRTLWGFISKPRTFNEIADFLAGTANGANGVSRDAVVRDLKEFLKELEPDFVSEVVPHESGWG
jgi:hypothetical protein